MHGYRPRTMGLGEKGPEVTEYAYIEVALHHFSCPVSIFLVGIRVLEF
jgi:hypothetical protein